MKRRPFHRGISLVVLAVLLTSTAAASAFALEASAMPPSTTNTSGSTGHGAESAGNWTAASTGNFMLDGRFGEGFWHSFYWLLQLIEHEPQPARTISDGTTTERTTTSEEPASWSTTERPTTSTVTSTTVSTTAATATTTPPTTATTTSNSPTTTHTSTSTRTTPVPTSTTSVSTTTTSVTTTSTTTSAQTTTTPQTTATQTTTTPSTTTPSTTTSTQTTTSQTTTEAPSTTTTSDEAGGVDRSEVERLVHEYVNEERTARGLEPLSFSTDLREIARYHSEDMATRGYFSHTSPDGGTFADRYERFDYTCRAPTGDGSYLTGGENIAQTWYDTRVGTGEGTVRYTTADELARGIVTQWMNSQGHRENILTPEWRNEGIGIVVTEDGKVYATQNFC